MSYLELCVELQEAIKSDEMMPHDEKEEILETLASLIDSLWSYSD